MSIIRNTLDRIHYFFDSVKVSSPKVKIEHFNLNSAQENIIVVYRLGRQKLLNKMSICQFEKEYFENVSNFDQHRLTKFSVLQHTLQVLFSNNTCDKQNFTRFIEAHVKNEQLF